MLVIALQTNVFVQGMSMVVQSSLVQGQNASLESSGTKKKKNYKLASCAGYGIHQITCGCV